MKRIFLLLVLLPFIFQGLAQKDVSIIRDPQQYFFNTQILNPQHSREHLKAIKSATIYKLDTLVRNRNPFNYRHDLEPNLIRIYTYDDYNYLINVLYKRYDSDSGSYVATTEQIYTRDANHNVVHYLEKTGYGTLNYYQQYFYSYDANNNLIEQKYQLYDNTIDDWVNNTLDSFYYNTQNLDTLSINYVWNTSDNQWQPFWKAHFYYDSFGNKIMKKTYFWNSSTSAWDIYGLDSFYYENGYLIRAVSYLWDYDGGSWAFNFVTDYIYDSNGNLILYYSLNRDLDTTYKKAFYYDSRNLLIKDTVWSRDFSTNFYGYLFNEVLTYDDSTNWISEIMQRWDTTSHSWINDRALYFSYNTDVNISNAIMPFNYRFCVNLPTRLLFKLWNTDSSYWYDTFEYLYKYETIITSSQRISNPFQITLYPNPADNVVNINIPDERQAIVSIYDENGRLVHTAPLITGQVNVKFLPTGTYFVVVRGKNKVYVGKFLKR